MFLLRNGFAAALLLALVQASAFATLKEDRENGISLAKTLVTSMDDPLIYGMESVVRNRVDSNSACAKELAALMRAFATGSLWALEMLDAASKIQSGILNGNLRDLGMYGQCVRSNGRINDTEVQGKHCTTTSRASYEGNLTNIGNASIALTSSICVPSSCDEADVIEIVTAAYKQLLDRTNIGLVLNVTGSSCARIESEDFSVGEILTIIFFASTGAIIFLCTICDFVKRTELVKINNTVNTLAKFSLYTNALSILSTKKTSGLMPALQGMRFICMCWVVLGHRYFTSMYRPLVNQVDIISWVNTWDAIYIFMAPFAVDTFFVISGFLMTYQYFKTLQSGRRVNIPMMYIHRYLRLTPAIAVVILFVVFLLHRVTNGPVWNTLSTVLIGQCQKNWWVNLLYLQNFVNKEQMCLPHSWYLAVDMQLFWISPFILYILYRWPKYGLPLLSCLLTASIITPAVVLAINNFYNALVRLDDMDRNFDTMYRFYIPTYNRACAYFVGIFLGYEVANYTRNPHKVIVAINWILTCLAIVFCTCITHILYRTDYEYNKILEVMFALVSRPIWSVATAWVAYACTQGYGGFVTSFLSLPVFLPLSRISYCIYLVHMVLQFTKNAAGQIPGIFSPFEMFNDFLADLILSIVLALFLSLFFESPVVILEKILRNRGRRPNRPATVSEYKKDVEKGIDNTPVNSKL